MTRLQLDSSRTRGDRSSIHAWLDRFAALLPVGASVLDLGAGPGVDSAELRQRGLRAVSVDLSLGMSRAGCREFPGTRVQADIRRLPFRSSSVAGVWANASLLHLAPAETAAALREARRVLQARGALHLSVKHGNGSEWETDRYGEPRWFQYWSAPELDAAIQSAGLSITDGWFSETSRTTWIVRLASRAL